jgi:hypothetical protein
VRDLCDDDEVADTAGGAEKRVLSDATAIGLLPGLLPGHRRLRACWCVEQAARAGQAVDLHTVGEQSIVANAHEAPGDDVQQETPGELGSGQGDGLPAPLVLAVLIDEGNAALLVRDEPFVGDGNPVRITTEIA